MVINSEFGLAGIFSNNPEEADRMRVKIIQDQMPELAKRDWIAGAILWCYQDYRSPAIFGQVGRMATLNTDWWMSTGSVSLRTMSGRI